MTHHTALNYSLVPEALDRIRESGCDLTTRLPFEFLVLNASRSGEARLAQWKKVGWGNCLWTVPAERMKGRRQHRVPLSPQAMAALAEAMELGMESNGLIFPSFNKGKPLSDMTFTALLRRMDIQAVPHGFRSSFKDWSGDTMGENYEIATELALARTVGNAARKPYTRSELLGPRRALMDAWGEFLSNHHR